MGFQPKRGYDNPITPIRVYPCDPRLKIQPTKRDEGVPPTIDQQSYLFTFSVFLSILCLFVAKPKGFTPRLCGSA